MSEPRAPDWLTAMPGKVRITSESCEKPLARASSPLIAVTDEPVFEASIGSRLGEMTMQLGQESGLGVGCAGERGDQRAGREAGFASVARIDMTCSRMG